ncbi:hypothetical protein GLOIN_2v1847398 [Rhizophagus clarus]|uniref:Uncharacterized protein n=1 Tax=Rhizophagus clarus TaxID=94130 RepID=A0A8H3L1Q1_9GLOM|nr:hypothetical protein GLOIN_2v1847398 [Rhizophagus clarus]
METRFMNIQEDLLLSNHLMISIDQSMKNMPIIKRGEFQNCFIVQNLILMKINKFAFYHDNTSLKKYKIPEGPTTIKKLLTDDQYHCYFPFFKKHNLIFVDQLTSLCKNFLLSIFELKEKRYTSYFKVTPTTKRLYTDLTRILYKNQRTLELKNNIKDIITYRDITHNLKGSITVYPYNNKTDKEKIAIFDIEDITDDYEKEIVFRSCFGCYRSHKGLKGLVAQEGKHKCIILGTTTSVLRISATKQPLRHLENMAYIQPEISGHFIKE